MILNLERRDLSPIPDNWRSCGVWIAPAARITSFDAEIVYLGAAEFAAYYPTISAKFSKSKTIPR